MGAAKRFRKDRPKLDEERQGWVLDHGWIVGAVVRRMPRFHPRDELTAAGWEGLCEAAQMFDRSLGIKFDTYAYPRVRMRVWRAAHVGLVDSKHARYAKDARRRELAARKVYHFSQIGDEDCRFDPGCEADPRVAAEEQDRREELSQAVDRLPNPMSYFIRMRNYQGLSLAQCAERLGRSIWWCLSLERRAHARLREMLGEGGDRP